MSEVCAGLEQGLQWSLQREGDAFELPLTRVADISTGSVTSFWESIRKLREKVRLMEQPEVQTTPGAGATNAVPAEATAAAVPIAGASITDSVAAAAAAAATATAAA